ncbi:hypothetical protein LTS08_000759 [Lithohypha guttulata]|nr:hypothetical protein LTS08_000759 [Lithohypha guttulata]
MSQRSKHGRLPPRPSEQTRCDPDIRAVLKTLIVDGKLAGRELSQEKDVAQAQLEKAFAAYLEQVPDIEKRVKNKIEDMKEMTGIMGAIKFEKMEDIKEVLKDHNWHTFRPSDSDEPYYRAMCLRKDGVLLGMDLEQYAIWQASPGTRERLKEIAEGRAEQVENDYWTHESNFFSSIDGDSMLEHAVHIALDGHEDQRCSPAKTSGQAASSAAGGRRQQEAPQQEAFKISMPGAFGEAVRYERRRMIYPPCYCSVCSNTYWNPSGFLAGCDYREWRGYVEGLVRTMVERCKSIAVSLTQHGEILRRRWARKSVAQRRNILLSTHDQFPSYNRLAKIVRGNASRQGHWSTDPVERNLIRGLVISNLNLDDLANKPEVLFEHLELRSGSHPSLFFFADLMRTQSATAFAQLSDIYMFGTFDITETHYGKWQTWQDEPVHRFEAMSCPFAIPVFDAQSCVLAVLFQVVLQLQNGLTVPTQLKNLPTTHTAGSHHQINLPTVLNFQSLFVKPSVLRPNLEMALTIAHRKLVQVTNDLQKFRQDSTAMLERIALCSSFMEALRSVSAMKKSHTVYLLLAEPHDRVLVWLHIRKMFDKVIKLRDSKDHNRAFYYDAIRRLIEVVIARGRAIVSIATRLCRDLANQKAIVPDETLNGCSTVQDWLEQYFFESPWQRSRIIKTLFMQMHCNRHTGSMRLVHGLIKDWIEEVTTVIGIIELIAISEPMLEMDITALYDLPTMIVGEKSNKKIQLDLIFAATDARLKGLKNILDAVMGGNSKINTRPSDLVTLMQQLPKTWSAYTTETCRHFQKCKFSASWIAAIQEVSKATAPIQPIDKVSLNHATEARQSRSPRKRSENTQEANANRETLFETSIPHHWGPDSPAVHKMTRKKRDEVNPASVEEQDSVVLEQEDIVQSIEMTDPVGIQISVKGRYLPIVDSLFANAQNNVSTVRWDKFELFMQDAGLEMKQGQGASVTFSGKNVLDGREASLVIHRPHPDPVFKAVHLRNNATKIREQFGWQKEMFVQRQRLNV